MLLVRTRLDTSRIQGLGLHADEDIPAGTPIWKFHPGIDLLISPAAVADLPGPARAQLARYAYRCQQTGDHVLCADDARFFNHADRPNTRTVLGDDGSYHDAAACDIARGEELTCDYRTFDADWRAKLGLSPETGRPEGCRKP